MLLIGYFAGIDSERGLEWRCADSPGMINEVREAAPPELARSHR
jgi:hypothetical protein